MRYLVSLPYKILVNRLHTYACGLCVVVYVLFLLLYDPSPISANPVNVCSTERCPGWDVLQSKLPSVKYNGKEYKDYFTRSFGLKIQ